MALAAVGYKGRASDVFIFCGDAFDGKGIKGAILIYNFCRAPTEQPQPLRRVQLAGVPGAVPDLARNGELRLLLTPAMQVPFQDVLPRDNDLAGLLDLAEHTRKFS